MKIDYRRKAFIRTNALRMWHIGDEYYYILNAPDLDESLSLVYIGDIDIESDISEYAGILYIINNKVAAKFTIKEFKRIKKLMDL